jgi:hypothetical protein
VDITDVDVWLYIKSGGAFRFKAIVDIKNRKSPKAIERVLWARGLQKRATADRAIVVTTDTSQQVVGFANEMGVQIIGKDLLLRLEKKLPPQSRISIEEFEELIKSYPGYKSDSNWLDLIKNCKSKLVGSNPFQSFNGAVQSFRYFASKSSTMTQHHDTAVRCAVLCAAIAAVALDSAMETVAFDAHEIRYATLLDGIVYGEGQEGRVQNTMKVLLEVVSQSSENGRAMASQIKASIDSQFGRVRADIIAEYFSREANAASLFSVARELEALAHSNADVDLSRVSNETKSILGVFLDYLEIPRSAMGFSGHTKTTSKASPEVLPKGSAEPKML